MNKSKCKIVITFGSFLQTVDPQDLSSSFSWRIPEVGAIEIDPGKPLNGKARQRAEVGGGRAEAERLNKNCIPKSHTFHLFPLLNY